MKLSFFLFKAEHQSFEGLLRQSYLNGAGAFVEVEATNQLPYVCLAYLQANKRKLPPWTKFLDQTYDLSSFNLANVSNSFLILIKAGGRIFAVTFGYAATAIDRSLIEPDFGLKVVLNALNPDLVRTLDTRNLGGIARQRRTQVSSGGRVPAFDVNTNQDWIRYVSGRPVDTTIGKNMAGADALSLVYDASLLALGNKCEDLLAWFQSERYKKAFGFIDNLRPLMKKDPRLETLEARLKAAVKGQDTAKLTLDLPGIVEEERVHQYRLSRAGLADDVYCEELSLAAVFEVLGELDASRINWKTTFVDALNDSGEPTAQRRSLKDYITAEFEMDGKIYLHTLGQWFWADQDFVTRTREEVRALADWAPQLQLPAMHVGEHEGAYNLRVADAKDWLLLDKRNYVVSHDKVEVCDLVSTDGVEFVCVKKLESSKTMSHLLSQASVSAILLNENRDYQSFVMERLAQRWPAIEGRRVRPRFVYAIASDKDGDLASAIYLFSLINLLEHVKVIRRAGFDVALCKIPYVEAVAERTVAATSAPSASVAEELA